MVPRDRPNCSPVLGEKLLGIWPDCPQNRTAVSKGWLVLGNCRRCCTLEVAVFGPPSEILLTLLELQSRSAGKPLKFWVVCPQNGTAFLKGLIRATYFCIRQHLCFVTRTAPFFSGLRLGPATTTGGTGRGGVLSRTASFKRGNCRTAT